MSETVLLVEDELALVRGLTDNLTAEGYGVHVVTRGDRAVPVAREERPDLIILDIMLPGRSGLDILRDLRSAGDDVPILMLTAKGDIVDRVVGLELGADDYLPKPFALRELMARVRALLRRAGTSRRAHELVLGHVRFDFRALVASSDHNDVTLTPHDILVLRVLAERRGEMVSRLDIVEEVCGLSSEATLRTVDNHIMALRRAVGDNPRRPRWIHTVRGEGYRLAQE